MVLAILGAPDLLPDPTPFSPASTSSSSDALAVSNFQRGHKRDTSKYKDFKGDRALWFVTKAEWNAKLTIDGVIPLLQTSYTIPTPDTEAFNFHSLRNNYIFSAIGDSCIGGQAKFIKQTFSASLDGIGFWEALVAYYEQPEAVHQVAQEALSQIYSLRLSDFDDETNQFLDTFQTYMTTYQQIRDFAPHQAKTMDDGEKIALLNACIDNDQRFAPIQTTVATLTKMGRGKSLTYSDYLEQILDASALMDSSIPYSAYRKLLDEEIEPSDRQSNCFTSSAENEPAAPAGEEDDGSATDGSTTDGPTNDGSATDGNISQTYTLASLLEMQVNADCTSLTAPTPTNTLPTLREILSSCQSTTMPATTTPAAPASGRIRPTFRDIMSSACIPTTAPTVLTPGDYQDSSGRTYNIR